jgi:hypothetical protein
VHAAAPVISAIADQLTREEPVSPLLIGLSATDADFGDGINFSFSAPNVGDEAAEVFCSITVDDGLGSGTLSCDPQLGDGDTYTIRVTATDTSGPPSESSFVEFELDVNATPSIDSITPKSVVEAGTIEIALSANDPDPGDALTFSFTAIPSAAESFCAITFDNGNGSGTLTCSPAVGDAAANPYEITVTATDNADTAVRASASTTIDLDVTANQAPTADPVAIDGNAILDATLNGTYFYDDAENEKTTRKALRPSSGTATIFR